jgi:hypothetical protein
MGRLGSNSNLEHKITFIALCNFQVKIGWTWAQSSTKFGSFLLSKLLKKGFRAEKSLCFLPYQKGNSWGWGGGGGGGGGVGLLNGGDYLVFVFEFWCYF